ncbi:MAG: NUDIX hydrolase [bacterium]
MKIKSSNNLNTTKFLNFKETIYEDELGNEKKWIWCQRPNDTKAVVIAAVVDKGFVSSSVGGYERDLRLVVTKEFRIPINDYEYGFPAGLVDSNESPVEAAKRELKEESNLDVKRVIRYTPYIYNTTGLTDESISMVYLECEGQISKDGNEASEDIETYLMDRFEVRNLIEDPNKKFGAKAYMIMDYFVRNNDI